MSNLTDMPADQPGPDLSSLPIARLIQRGQQMAPLGRDQVSTHVSTGLQPANRTANRTASGGGLSSL